MLNFFLRISYVLLSFIFIYCCWVFIPDTLMKSNEKMTFFIGVAVMIATWISADSSRKSSLIAQKVFEDNLRSSKYNNFEQHYNSLFALHNDLHNSVCDFLDTTDKKDHNGRNIVGGKSYFDNVRKMKTLEEAHNTLMGHSVISPYMRVLYHLLKHIFSYTDDPDVFKKYTSPLRSMVRNDVLYLIALNASVIYKDSSNDDNGYQDYRKYLNKCVFFEHAIFTSDEYKNFNEVKTNFLHQFNACISTPIWSCLMRYMTTLKIESNDISFTKDHSLCVIFENPLTSVVNDAYEGIMNNVNNSYLHYRNEYVRKIKSYEDDLADICSYYNKEREGELYTLLDSYEEVYNMAMSHKDEYALFFVKRSDGSIINCINVVNRILELKDNKNILQMNEEYEGKINDDMSKITNIFQSAFNRATERYKLP